MERMIWFALGVVVYAVMGLYLLALCRAASCADGQVRPSASEDARLARLAGAWSRGHARSVYRSHRQHVFSIAEWRRVSGFADRPPRWHVRGLHERQRVDGLRGRDLRHEGDQTRWHRAG
jgi:hypothetical protein